MYNNWKSSKETYVSVGVNCTEGCRSATKGLFCGLYSTLRTNMTIFKRLQKFHFVSYLNLITLICCAQNVVLTHTYENTSGTGHKLFMASRIYSKMQIFATYPQKFQSGRGEIYNRNKKSKKTRKKITRPRKRPSKKEKKKTVKKTRKYDRDRFLGRVLFYLVAFLVEFFFSWSLSWLSSFFLFFFFSYFLVFFYISSVFH